MTKFQILKQILITEGQVIAECRVVLACKITLMNSQLGNCRLWTAVLKLGEGV